MIGNVVRNRLTYPVLGLYAPSWFGTPTASSQYLQASGANLGPFNRGRGTIFFPGPGGSSGCGVSGTGGLFRRSPTLGGTILDIEAPGTGQSINDLLNAGYTPQEIAQLFPEINLSDYPGPLPADPANYTPPQPQVPMRPQPLPPGPAPRVQVPQQQLRPGTNQSQSSSSNWQWMALGAGVLFVVLLTGDRSNRR